MSRTMALPVSLALLLAGCTPADTSSDTGMPQEGVWLGLCDAWDAECLEGGVCDLEPMDAQVQRFADLGMGLARPHRPSGHVFAMNVVHPDAQTWDFTLADHVVQEAQEAQVQLLVTLQPQAFLEDRDRFAPTMVSTEELEAWQTYVERVVERYDGDGLSDMPGLEEPVLAWELGNEPVCPPGVTECMEDHLATMQAGWEAAHRAHAEAQVMAGGARPVFDPHTGEVNLDPLELWGWFFEHGGAEYTDAFSFHLVTGSAAHTVEDYLDQWAPVVPEDMPLWMSESGPYGVQGQASHEDPEVAAQWYVGQLEEARRAGVQRAMLCMAQSTLDDRPDLEQALAEWLSESR